MLSPKGNENRPLKTIWKRGLTLCLFAAVTGSAMMLYVHFPHVFNLPEALYLRKKHHMDQDEAYILNLPGCKIPKLDPWHSSLKFFYQVLPDLNCTGIPDLVSIEKSTSGAIARINMEVVRNKYGGSITCSLAPIYWENDEKYVLGSAHYFTADLKINETYEFVKIKCKHDKKSTVYVDFHAFINQKPNVEERILRSSSRPSTSKHQFNILLLGVDSTSKNQFLRHMRRSYKFICDNLTYVEMHGYNKLGQNTYPNMVPFLTGRLESEIGDTTKEFVDDALPLIWRDFQDVGYRTLFSEDEPDLSIFNFGRRGFRNKPTDYYLRPFSLAIEPYIDLKSKPWSEGCVNQRSEASVILQWTEDFLDSFPKQPLFSFTFLTRLSHGSINGLSHLDKPVFHFLNSLDQKGHLNNSIIFLFSDHGIRYGDIRWTFAGRMEGKLPFMFIIVPSWFPAKHPQLYNNLIINQRRLTTPLDIYATIKGLLHFDGEGYSEDGIGRSINLMKLQVSENRTCKSANIKTQWCACIQEQSASIDDPRVVRCAEAIIHKINSKTSEKRHLCADLTLANVLSASYYPVHLGEDKPFDGATTYLVTLITAPNNATFEGTVMHNGKSRYSVDSIERTDQYGNQSACIYAAVLKPYCFCKQWESEKVLIEDIG